MEFKLKKEQWYALRDDRTRRVDGAHGFENFMLGVIVSSEIRTSFEVQVMTLITLKVSAMWCRNIIIELPASPIDCLFISKEKKRE